MGSPAVVVVSIVLAVLGDSISVGDYPEMLQEKAGLDSMLVERSSLTRNGVRLETLVRDVEQTGWGVSRSPTHALFFAGLNDCISGATGQRAVRAIEKAVDVSKRNGVCPVIVVDYPAAGFIDGQAYPGDRDLARSCLGAISYWGSLNAGRSDLAVVSMSDLGDKSGRIRDRYDSGDGLHPNHRGQRKIADILLGHGWNR